VRGLLGELLSTQAEMTVVDMEAGLEHLSRSGGTLRYVDHLLVVVEPYAKAIETARRTVRLAQELGIARISLLASKVREHSELALLDPLRAEFGVELIGVVPYDDAARLADRAGLPPIEVAPHSALVAAVSRLADSLTAPRPALV
jgi:CO dehydrogenase maturation factor